MPAEVWTQEYQVVGAEVVDNWVLPMEQLSTDKKEWPTASMAKAIADLQARGCSGATVVHPRDCCHRHLYPRHQSLPCQRLSYHDHQCCCDSF